MTTDELKQKLEAKRREIIDYARNDAPDVIGIEAVNQFKENFDNESFDGAKWAEVERRNPGSPWYGHSGQTGKFSRPRTTAKILSGETGALRNAISYRKEAGRTIITNDRPYAAVHNEGGPAMIYGKKPFVMKKRQFAGVTDELEKNIINKIKRDINNILNS